MTKTIRRGFVTFTLVVFATILPCNSFAFRNVKVGAQLPNATLGSLDGKHTLVLSPKARVNLFLFFRPNQEHSITALSILAKVCDEFKGRSIRCVAIVSDYHKKELIKRAIQGAGWKYSATLVDKNDFYYGKLGTTLHPSFGIADASLTLLAYEPFSEINYFQRIKANVRYSLGDIDEKQLKLALNPPLIKKMTEMSHASPHLNYAKMLMKAGKLDKALEQAKQALTIDDHLAAAHALLGTIYARQNKCGKAKPEFEKALALDKNNSEANTGKRLCK